MSTSDRSPSPASEELLAQSAWLAVLARSLVRDDATARDVVQETSPSASRRSASCSRRWRSSRSPSAALVLRYLDGLEPAEIDTASVDVP